MWWSHTARAAGAVFSMTRLLSFFHQQASFTSGDSGEKDETSRYGGGGVDGAGELTELSKGTNRITRRALIDAGDVLYHTLLLDRSVVEVVNVTTLVGRRFFRG